jgi:tripartite-type tricarboxylate transporter receptor subunit TctC
MMLRHVARPLAAAALLTAALFGSGTASAQTGIIRFVVGLAPGGAVDPYARIIADQMSKILGQTIIVENKPGAGGNISAQYMIDAPANGTMVWVSTQALTEINPSVYHNLKWSIDQFTPLIKGIEAPLVFVANPSVPANTLAEFITWAKANRGKLSYSSYTAGTPSHFLGYQMNEKFDLDMVHVPYRGSGLQATALISGEAKFGFAQVNSSLPQIRAGKMKAFAITGATRDHSLPDVPTFAELGHPEFTAKVWFGLLVKAGTPQPIVDRLTDAAKRAHADPEVKAKLEAQGYDVVAETGPQLLPNIKTQGERWGKLVKASGFSAEDRGNTK